MICTNKNDNNGRFSLPFNKLKMSASGILDKIKHELSVFASFTAVVNKSEKDGSLEHMTSMLSSIVKNEIDFAIRGELSRVGKLQTAAETVGREESD